MRMEEFKSNITIEELKNILEKKYSEILKIDFIYHIIDRLEVNDWP